MSYLSKHFTLDELTVTDHREFDNSPTQVEISNLQRLAQLLEQVKRSHWWQACNGELCLPLQAGQ